MTQKNGHAKGGTAHHLMTDRVPTVSVEATVADVENLLLGHAKNFESIHYVYVVDTTKKLVGVISVKDVFRQPKGMPIARFMKTAVVTAKPSHDQEKIAYTALRHNIKAVPIVNKEGIFLGAVTADHILRTLHHEMSADLFRFAGAPGAHRHATSYDDILHLSLSRALLHRLPWLFVGLLGGIGIAHIIGSFETLLAEHLVLTTFVPLVVYMAAAVTAQTNAFVIRDLAVGARIRFGTYFFKEFRNDIAIAFVTALTLMSVIGLWQSDWMLGAAVATALFVAVASSIATGLLVPYALSRVRVDPANGTGPLATILQDALSVALYFSIASLFF